MELKFRNVTKSDQRAVEELTREAFWNVYAPGCDEHYLAHLLWQSGALIPELALVAELDGELAGNILYTRAGIVDGQGEEHAVATFGPVSVRPKLQGRGIGQKLIEHSLSLARGMGIPAVFIYGDPDYYRRCGLLPAERFGVRNREGKFAAALQGIELLPGALRGITGRFVEDPVFEIDPAASKEFDRSFPKKEKGYAPSQDRFLELVGMVHD